MCGGGGRVSWTLAVRPLIELEFRRKNERAFDRVKAGIKGQPLFVASLPRYVLHHAIRHAM